MDLESARALKTQIRAATARQFAVGISLTNSPGEYRVTIFVPAGQLAPACDGVDVETVPVARAATAPIARRSGSALTIGASVGHVTAGVGSLGFFARRRSDDVLGLVSCNHVIAKCDEARDGDAIVSPSIIDGGGNIIGSLDGRYPRLADSVADCAFAVLAEGVAYDASTLDEGATLSAESAHITPDLRVTKTGRVTNARPGVVKKIEVDGVCIRYGAIRATFDGVMMIASDGDDFFCRGGDSGALVYTSDTSQPVGLLFANAYSGGPNNRGWTWVHPIDRVLAALDVRLVNR